MLGKETVMAEKRDHKRIMCSAKCNLYHENSKYCGAIINISIAGALFHFPGLTQDIMATGDKCSIILGNEPAASFCKYNCRIARVDSAGAGLQILEHEF